MTAQRIPSLAWRLGGRGAAATALWIVFTVAVVACGGPPAHTDDLLLSMQVEPANPQMGDATLVVTVTDKDGKPVDDAVVEVEGNMTHPGMVPVTARAQGGTDGTYRLPFTWSMGGDWVITVKARLPDGRQAQADFPFSVESN